LDERKSPRDQEEMTRLLGPLLVTLGLGESLPLPGAAQAEEEIPREPDSLRTGGMQ
jgi:hypothetical protein